MPIMTQTQKIEKLETFSCQQAIQYGGTCGELADYRVVNQGVSITLCDIHAGPFLKGQMLEVLSCSVCSKPCKPGYIFDQDSQRNFCSQRCRDGWYTQVSSRVRYR
jgi:hypothetical protein